MPDGNQNRISSINSPHELALGVAFGVVIGLMPKDSAFPWLIGLLFLLSRGNLLCGIIAGVMASVVSPTIDGISDRLGVGLLSIEFMQDYYASWIQLPWVPWTRFNNTVVAGSLSLGLIASVPVYLLSQVFFRLWGIAFIERIMNLKFIRLLFGEADANVPSESEPTLVSET